MFVKEKVFNLIPWL